MKRILWILAGLFLIGMVVGAALISSRQPAPGTTSTSTEQTASPSSQGPAPNFSLKLLNGKKITLKTFNKGRPVVINFWASWCPSCRQEAPDLERVYRKYKNQGVEFLGIIVQDTTAKAKSYIKEFDITYANGHDAGDKIGKAYRITGVPETFLVTKDREIAYKIIGATTERDLSSLIEENLLR